MKKIILFFILSLCFFLIKAQESDSIILKNLSSGDFYILTQSRPDAVIIDVRNWQDFKKNRIPDAHFANNSKQLKAITDTLDFEQPILIYSWHGERSVNAAKFLIDWEFKNLYHLQKGIEEWQNCNYSLDTKRIWFKK